MKNIVILMFLLLPFSVSASQANWLGTWGVGIKIDRN